MTPSKLNENGTYHASIYHVLLLAALLQGTYKIPKGSAFQTIIRHYRPFSMLFGTNRIYRGIASKSEIRVSSESTSISGSNPIASEQDISSWLVCGDGDLSFSASIAPELANSNISLTATVLEDQEAHHKTYKNSTQHLNQIVSSWDSHSVHFGVDATNISASFGNATFDRIQFNFPHWRGKANNKRNRELLSAFLRSANKALAKNGEVHVALCQGQGGATASTLQEWKHSWLAAELAAEHGLLLRNTVPFQTHYDRSSHRGADRPFRVGDSPKLYVFDSAERAVEQRYQLCCRHELHIELPTEDEFATFSRHDIIHGGAISSIIQNIVPTGVQVEVPIRKVLSPSESGCNTTMVVFLVVYCGRILPLTRGVADRFRETTEGEVGKYVSLRANRVGRLVSRPFPYCILQELIDQHT